MAAPFRRFAFAVLASLSALVLATPDAMADKLVIFKNGKAMRVKSATLESKWLKFDLDGENFIAVRASEVEAMEDVAGGSSEGSLTPNQVADGSGGGAYSPRQNQPADDGGYQGGEVAAASVGAGDQPEEADSPEDLLLVKGMRSRAGPLRGTRGLTQQGQQPVRLPGGLPVLTPGAGRQQVINRSLSNRNIPANRQISPRRSLNGNNASPDN